VSAGKDGVVRLWDDNGALVAALNGHLGRSVEALIDRSGRVMSIGVDSTLRVWDPSSGLLGAYKSHRGTTYQLLERDGLVVTSDDGAVVIHRFRHAAPDLEHARQLARCLPLQFVDGRIVTTSAAAPSCP
jgi:WD40 repeat protein